MPNLYPFVPQWPAASHPLEPSACPSNLVHPLFIAQFIVYMNN